jgi:hypothetical protein
MDIYQHIWIVTSPSLCLSHVYTDTQGHRYVWMTPCLIYYRGTHDIEVVGTLRFRVVVNMEGQTSGGVRVAQTVGPEGQEDDQQEGAVEQAESVSVVASVITTSHLEYLSVTSLNQQFWTHNLAETGSHSEDLDHLRVRLVQGHRK